MPAIKLKASEQTPENGEWQTTIAESMESIHKQTIKPIVTQILSIYTALLIISSFSWTFNWVLVLLIAGATAAFNIYMDNRIVEFSFFGRQLRLGSDASDAVRWLVNILFADIPLSFFLDLSPMALAGFWTLVLISIIAETFKRTHRLVVFSTAFVSSVICLHFVNSNIQISDTLFWMLNQFTIAAFFVRIESFWSTAILQQLESTRRMNEAMVQVESLHRNALIGEHARIISHEVANLVMGFNLLTHSKDDLDYAPLKAGLNYLQRISRLVLDDIQVEPLIHNCAFDDLIHDINAVLGKQIRQKHIVWKLERDLVPAGIKFNERSGSTFLMLQNIIKNACEAIHRKHSNPGNGCIKLICSYADNGLVFTVEDNGDGLSDLAIKQIKNGESRSSTITGHGLGLRFVVTECRKNNFSLNVQNGQNGGAKISISISA